MIFLQCTQKIKTRKPDEDAICSGNERKKLLYLQLLMVIIFCSIEREVKRND